MHKLKSWPEFFQAIVAGKKTHDLRSLLDRELEVGQHLILQEYDPFTGEYTGDEVEVEITYMTDYRTPCAFSSAVLAKGYTILSIKLVDAPQTDVLDELPDTYSDRVGRRT